MIKIAILGSTGSIGTQTLDIVRKNKDLEVVGIAAGSNIAMLEEQIREFHPKLAAVGDEKKAEELSVRVKDTNCKVVGGMDGLLELAAMEESQILVTAIVGMIGIRPTIEGIKAGKDIALANKETLVTAGHLIMPLAKEYGAKILPVDSEHSAIFQALNGEEHKSIDKLLITASGGPFRGRKTKDLEHIQVEDALKHPNWAMGQKITIDSATLVNKGLEVMEAKWLFRRGFESDSGSSAASKCDSFYGAVYRWKHYCSAWYAGYASAHSVCSLWGNQKISGWRKTGFCKIRFYYL